MTHRNAQRSLLAVRLGEVNPPHRERPIRSLLQFARHFIQPPIQAVGLDVLERLAIHPRHAAVGTAPDVGEFQDVAAVHLVVQHVEPITGRSLRFDMQRLLEFPNLRRR